MLRTVARLRRNVNGIRSRLVGHQRHVGGLSSAASLPAAPIAMPDVGQCKRGRVVDAVADHRHRPVRSPQLLNRRDLVLRQQLRADLVDAELGSHRLGGPGAVAGQHDDPRDALTTGADRRRLLPLSRARSASDDANRPFVARHDHGGLSGRIDRQRPIVNRRGCTAVARRTDDGCRAATRRLARPCLRRPVPG